jgi:curved DNA-binding protein CbpA
VRYVPDPYKALGLPRGASEADVKAAHRKLAKRYHPDAPGGDTERFLLVQEAYKLLVDPLRRREWDARHAPGPVRASDGARTRPRAANGRWTRAEGTAGQQADRSTRADPMSAGARDPASRTYTWSASEVPWWEEGASRAAKRPPGRRRPREEADTAAGPAAGAGPASTETAAPDFDVYNRSSGAAWSMAARAYFRRGEQELPRRGSFHHAGSQPLTAARARAAQEEETRRTRSAGAATRPSAQVAQPGVVRDAESISEVRAAARERVLAARWPSLGQRLLYALLAWIPIALLIGYGGAWATGCDRASVACPPELATFQTISIALALGLLVAMPRLAYALTLAAVGLLIGALALVIGIWVLGLRPPLSPWVLAVSTALLLVVHLAVATWVLSGGVRRPWAAAQRFNRFGRR